MINQYQYPQSTIAQVLEDVANPLLGALSAVVVGPAYVHADVASANLIFNAYESTGSYALRRKTATGTQDLTVEVVEPDSVGLQARGLRLDLYAKGSPTASPTATQFQTYAPDPTGRLLLYGAAAGLFSTADVNAAGTYDAGRAPQPGDIFKVTSSLGTVESKVLGLVGKDVAGSAATAVYTGAAVWVPGTAQTLAVLSNSVALTSAFVSVNTTARLYIHRNGVPAPSDSGGLRLTVAVNCTQAGAPATAVFSAVVNGRPVAVTNALGATGVTNFTMLGGLVFSATRTSGDWQAGEQFTLDIRFDAGVTSGIIAGAAGVAAVTNYTYASALRRVSSVVSLEVLAVDAGATTVRVSDSAGLLTPTTYTLTGVAATFAIPFDGVGTLTLGFTVDLLYTVGAHVGQRWAVAITPPSRSTTVFDKVQLASPIGMVGAHTGLRVEAFTNFSGKISAIEPVLGGTNFTRTGNSIVASEIQVAIAGYPIAADSVKAAVTGFGEVAPLFRAVKPVGTSEGIRTIKSSDDIINFLGSNALASELGYGAQLALNGAQGKQIFLLNTGASDTDLSAWAAALKKLEAAQVYAIALCTENEAAMQLLSSHCQRMSVEGVKRFRRGYVGTDSPGEYPILSVGPDGLGYRATVTAGSGGLINLVSFAGTTLDLEILTITRGDLMILSDGSKYPIEAVTGPRTLVLQGGVPSAITTASFVTLVAADTPENTARFVWQRSQRLGAGAEQDRRIANIWTDDGVIDRQDGFPQRVPNRFGACEIAGIRTALQPQQSLTRTEVSYITDAPTMYTRFTQEILDEMAANGVWIVTQRSSEAIPVVRHQLTTATNNGPLFYEDSAGINVDSVCFAIDAIVDPLIGKRNATAKTVAEIKNLLLDMLNDLTEADYDSVLGPQLAAFYNTNGDIGTLDVSINATFKDRVDVRVVLEIPLPLNNIRVVVLSRTITLGGAAVNALTTSTL